MWKSAAHAPSVVVIGLALAAGTTPVYAQAGACLEGRGGIMTDPGFDLGPRPAGVHAGAGAAAPQLAVEPRITDVRQDGPAEGRLREGDVLLEVDGLPITTAEGARRFAELEPGDRVRLSIRRDQQRLNVTLVTMGRCIPHPPAPPEAPAAPAPESPPAPAAPLPAGDELMPEGGLGFTIRCDDCAEDRQTGVLRFNAPPLVVTVDPASPAAAAGLRSGDRLTHMNGAPLTSPSGWPRFYAIQPGETVRFRVARGGQSLEVTLRADRR